MISNLREYAIKSIRMFLWPNRHRGILPFEGGYVYPRDEIRRQIRIVRKIDAGQASQ